MLFSINKKKGEEEEEEEEEKKRTRAELVAKKRVGLPSKLRELK